MITLEAYRSFGTDGLWRSFEIVVCAGWRQRRFF